MASNINPTNIDGNYPIAGQDNDSQGFRDNFTNIKTNISYAKIELEDLQKKVIVKSSLIGTTVNNDMAGTVLYRPQLKAVYESFRIFPGNQIGSITVSFLDAMVQQIETSGGLIVNLTDYPPAGNWGSVKVWLRVIFTSGQTSAKVTLPETVTMGINKISNFNNDENSLTFTTPGDYLYEFCTADAGANFWIIQLG